MAGKNLSPFRQARKSGFSVVISITGFAEPYDRFRIEKDGNKIILTKVE